MAATGDALQDVTGSPAGPYFIHHPALPATETVLFLPGGAGTRQLATLTHQAFLSAPTTPDDVRVIVPYSETDFPSESERALAILDEVIECYGADPNHVHLAGTSLGGIAAFNLMLSHSARFRTLLGVPGAFTTGLTEEWTAALSGKAIYVGVGENDADPWPSAAQMIHDAMTAAGVDSTHVVFEGEGHVVSAAFDETVFFDFWRADR